MNCRATKAGPKGDGRGPAQPQSLLCGDPNAKFCVDKARETQTERKSSKTQQEEIKQQNLCDAHRGVQDTDERGGRGSMDCTPKVRHEIKGPITLNGAQATLRVVTRARKSRSELGGPGAWRHPRITLHPDSTVKAAFSLERSCPKWSLAPAWAITWMVAGIVLAKGNGPTPMERLCKYRYPGRARLNSSARTRLA